MACTVARCTVMTLLADTLCSVNYTAIVMIEINTHWLNPGLFDHAV